MKKEIKQYLEELGLNQNEVNIYLALTKLGEATAAEIGKRANLPRTTAQSILEKLKLQQFFSSHKYRGKTYYWIESPNVFKEDLLNKVTVSEKLTPLLNNLYRTDRSLPTARFFDTQLGVRKFIEKTLLGLEKKSIIYTIDTPGGGNYSKLYSESVGKIVRDIKKKRQVITHTLIPYGSYNKIEPTKLKDHDIVIRELPQVIEFKASLWIINDSVFHFSGNPPFIAAIKHDHVIIGIKSIFDYLWSISKKI